MIVCPIGPLTNIATALQRNARFAKNVRQIVLMGGSLRAGGNITPEAEANFYHDPHAAQIVMAADCPVTMVGLDVTQRTWATREDMAAISDAAPNLGGFLRDITDFYIDFYVRVCGKQGCFLHDLLAIIYATHPELFDCEPVRVDVVLEGPGAGRSIVCADAAQRVRS